MTTTAAESRPGRLRAWLIGLILVLLAGYALKLLYPVVMPLAVAAGFVALVWPIVAWGRRRLSDRWKWLALVPAMLVYVGIVAAVVGAIWLTIDVTTGRWDQISSAVNDTASKVQNWARDLPGAKQVLGEDGGPAMPGDFVSSFARRLVEGFWAIVGFVVLIFFLALLMMIELPRWPAKLRKALGSERGERTVSAVSDSASKVRQYLLVRTGLSAISAVAGTTWLAIMGVPLWPVWGIVIFVMNYIPNLGSILAVIPPTLMALAVQGPMTAVLAIGGLFVIEQIIGNYIDPRWQGHRLRLSETLVLLSVIFWGWAWGVAGAFLGVPITAALVVAADYVPALRPISLLASKDERGQDG